MGGCKALHRCGIAANPPIAPERHPRAVTAKPTANGNCVRVRFSIGTLKDASMVAYFSESNRSRLRNVFMGSVPATPPSGKCPGSMRPQSSGASSQTRMTNDQIRRNDQTRMDQTGGLHNSEDLDIRASDFFRHSSFVIRHSKTRTSRRTKWFMVQRHLKPGVASP